MDTYLFTKQDVTKHTKGDKNAFFMEFGRVCANNRLKIGYLGGDNYSIRSLASYADPRDGFNKVLKDIR
jgi:hypothetical protein